MRDPTTILLPKDHAPERKESFYAKIKVSAFANSEVGRLIKKMKKKKKKMENWWFSNFPYVIEKVYLTYFEIFNVYKNTRRPCYVSEKGLKLSRSRDLSSFICEG